MIEYYTNRKLQANTEHKNHKQGYSFLTVDDAKNIQPIEPSIGQITKTKDKSCYSTSIDCFSCIF
ncbi:hypothetical protein VQ7734_04514 [Vibrio quintilis]|uniref:Uncharacterized protein n=1 Tax=Vibrio quintilis TaxID=1117707 RepID=A0A1M7Z1Q5_9VIBR|nr:hypothetical protein VQ7734_04514 [Vibrio quintilis]